MFKLLHNCPHLTCQQSMLKILQARLQQYMNRGVAKSQTWLSDWTELNWTESLWLCRSQQTVDNSSRDGNTRPPYLSLEKSVCSQEATVRTGHGTTDCFQIEKGVPQGCVMSPCLCNLYTEFSQFSSVAQLCPILFDSMHCSMPGLPVHHQLLEFTQTHVHWVSDAIQSSHPLSYPSPPAFNHSQHQGLFKRVSSLDHMARVLEFQLQH